MVNKYIFTFTRVLLSREIVQFNELCPSVGQVPSLRHSAVVNDKVLKIEN